MVIRVTLGEPMWRDVGARHQEIEFTADAHDTTVSIAQLVSRLGIELSDAEGTLLIIVNGQFIPSEEAAEFTLHGQDHVEFHMMLTGG